MDVRIPVVALALLATLPLTARADFVGTAEQVRAQRAKISKGLPEEAAAALHVYPGAKLDVECSAGMWDGSTDYYVLRTPDSVARVQAFYREKSIDATRGRVDIDQDTCGGTVGSGTAIALGLYPTAKVAELRAAAEQRRQGVAELTANPPDPATHGRPLPPDAVFDPECSYDQTLARQAHQFERVICYRVAAPDRDTAYKQLRALNVRPGSWEYNVVVRIEEQPAPVRLFYLIGNGGPEKPRATAATASTTPPAASPPASGTGTPAPGTPAPAPAAAPTADPADAAKKAVDKLKGLFGR